MPMECVGLGVCVPLVCGHWCVGIGVCGPWGVQVFGCVELVEEELTMTSVNIMCSLSDIHCMCTCVACILKLVCSWSLQ